MFFRWFRKGKKSRPPSLDEEYEDDFGYEATGSDTSRRVARAPEPRDTAPPAMDPDPPMMDPDPAGRRIDEDTIVTGVRSSSPSADDEAELPDATRYIQAVPDPQAAVIGWLVATTGTDRGKDFRLGSGSTRLGTSRECPVRLSQDQFASGTHAEVVAAANGFVLRDLGSTNGTFHNDTRVQEVSLEDGDRIRCGTSRFVFKSVRL